MDTQKSEVENLIAKAAGAHDSGDAMRYSQAACNAANAIACVQQLLKNAYGTEGPRREDYGMFGAIANAVNDLRRESERVADLDKLHDGIVTGELQEILDWVREATCRLKRVH